MRSILIKLGRFAWEWAENNCPWTNVYGLARSLLALGTALTFICNETSILFRPASGVPNYPICREIGTIGIFCNFDPYLETARWVSIVILLVVASGWRPRYTALFHWWISFSLNTSAITLDGGDQVTAVLTFLLLPIALTDSRKWHWESTPSENKSQNTGGLRFIFPRLFALTAWMAIRFQVAIIYFHAATAKLAIDEWVDGTILYYWFTDPVIGLPDWLKFINPLFTGPLVSLITWSSLIMEILFFMALVMPKKRWNMVLTAGIFFHVSIGLSMGLISFGFAMVAALLLYLRPLEQEFSFEFIWKLFATRKFFTKKMAVSSSALIDDGGSNAV